MLKHGEFAEEPVSQESMPNKNSLKSEHLKEGTGPIIACVGELSDFENEGLFLRKFYTEDPKNYHNVDYWGDPDDLEQQNFKNAGESSYVISPIDALDKRSRTFVECTGMIITGKDKKTGENISFLSHQDPRHFLEEGPSFIRDLKERTEELQKRCIEGTIDAVIFGGRLLKDEKKTLDEGKYLESISFLTREMAGLLGFEPVVITGPKITPGPDDVFYENRHRRLYIIRPQVGDATTESYRPTAIERQEKKWRRVPGNS